MFARLFKRMRIVWALFLFALVALAYISIVKGSLWLGLGATCWIVLECMAAGRGNRSPD